MKKSNMLIAVFVVLAAASVAKAGEIEIDFDGTKGLKPQSMHDIFAGSHQIVPQEALAKVTLPVPADPDESPVPMIEPWNIDPMGYCMMIPWTDENGVLHDCGTQPNTTPGYCEEIEIAPGIILPLCLTDDAIIAYKDDTRLLGTLAAGIKHGYVEYSSRRPGLTVTIKRISKDKNAKILYNGKRLFLVKRPAGRWHSDESLAAHSDYIESHPETQGHIEVALPAHTLTDGTMGAASGTLAGAVMGAVYGFFQDVNDYANGNN